MNVYHAWMERRTRPHARAYDIAQDLALPEGALLRAAPPIGADAPVTVGRLADRPRALAEALSSGVKLTGLTRNPTAVLEVTGAYGATSLFEGHGLGQTLGDVELRWVDRAVLEVLRVDDQTARGPRRSLQWIAPDGVVVHKAFAEDEATYARLGEFPLVGSVEVPPAFVAAPTPTYADLRAPGAREALHAAWSALEDTHDFFPMLRRLGARRIDAVTTVGAPFVEELPAASLRALLDDLALLALPFLIFVQNRAVTQVAHGPVRRVVPMEARDGGPSWLNILDPGLSLHVQSPERLRCFRVRKPTRQGLVVALEAYDEDGELAVLLVGDRRDGAPPDPVCRERIEALSAL